MPHPFFAGAPLAIAHRGSEVLWPENTMYAFQRAVDLGYRYLETDLHATTDRVLVAFHDDSVDRVTGSTGPIARLSSAEVRELDAAYHFAPVEGYPLRGSGVGVPTLEEIVTAFPDIRLVLDLKQSGIEGLLADFVRRHRLEERVIVGSFYDTRVARFRRLTGGEVATSTGPAETALLLGASRVRLAPRIPSTALFVPEEAGRVRVVDARMVDAAHRAGKYVAVWTVNEPQRMSALLDLGVDGIITGRPDLLKDVLAERGLWV